MNILARSLAALTCLVTLVAAAQTPWPTRPVTLVVPYTAGGGVDVVARLIAQSLGERLGQPVVVDNKPGVSGVVGAQFVARAAPDGYTLLAGNTTTNATNLFLTKGSSYDPRKDFAPLSLIDAGPLVLVVPANSRFNSVQDVLKEARAKPGGLSYGSSGTGSAQHLASEVFQNATKTKLLHVPYKGSPQVINDLLGGQLDLAFEVLPVAVPFVQSGRLKALGVTSPAEMSMLRGVKPIGESAVPGFEMTTWHGVFAPAGTPPAVAERLGREISAVVKLPAVQKRLQELGLIPDDRRNAEFAAFLAKDIARWGALIRDAGIEPN